MSKLSPGGWHQGTGNGEGSIFADEGRMRLEEGGTTLYPICKMIKGWNPEEDEANEIAVAAVPDLVAALKVAFQRSCQRSESRVKWTVKDQEAHEIIKAAIKKAGIRV